MKFRTNMEALERLHQAVNKCRGSRVTVDKDDLFALLVDHQNMARELPEVFFDEKTRQITNITHWGKR